MKSLQSKIHDESLTDKEQDEILNEVMAALGISISLKKIPQPKIPECQNIIQVPNEIPQSKEPECNPHLSRICKKSPSAASLSTKSDVSDFGSLTSNGSSPQLTSNDSSPRLTSNDSSPRLTSNDSSPRLTSNDSSPRLTSNGSSPRLTSNDSSPRGQQAVSNSALGTYRFGKRNLVQRLRSRERRAYLECLRQEKPRQQFGDVAVNATSARNPRKASISFSVFCQTNFGEDVRIVGNVQALGQWDPNFGAAMQWSDGHEWQATIEVEFSPTASRKHLEFKYVLMSQGKLLRWESRENRNVNQPMEGSLLMLRDVWDHA